MSANGISLSIDEMREEHAIRSGVSYRFEDEFPPLARPDDLTGATGSVARVGRREYTVSVPNQSDYLNIPIGTESSDKHTYEFTKQIASYFSEELGRSLVPVAPPLEIQWDQFLSQVENDPERTVSKSVVNSVRKVKEQLDSYVHGRLAPPQAENMLEEDGMVLIWKNNKNYLKIEIRADDSLFWFYKNLQTNEYLGEEGKVSDKFPPKKLANFLKRW